MKDELDEIVRAVSAGMLFGIPLLYTMEVWWVGTTTGPSRMLAVLAVTFAVLVVLNHTAGFRESKDVRIADRLQAYAESGVTTLSISPWAPTHEGRIDTLRTIVEAAEKAGVVES